MRSREAYPQGNAHERKDTNLLLVFFPNVVNFLVSTEKKGFGLEGQDMDQPLRFLHMKG